MTPAAKKETRVCDVCGLNKIQQFPGDPLRSWYWYCPREGLISHVKSKLARALSDVSTGQ